MKVMLIMPPLTVPKQSMKRCIVPMGIAYIAAYLEKHNINVKIVDCIVEGYDTEVHHDNGLMTYGLKEDEIKKRIEEFNPGFVGISCLETSQAHNAHRICKLVKQVNPDIQTIMGGAHPSALQHMVLKDKNVDHIAIGEGEQSMLDIVLGKKQGVVSSELLDVNDIPWPARHLLPMEKYIKINMPTSVFGLKDRTTQIETSRGCPFNCCFCCTTHFWGRRFRGRDPKDVLEEIRFVRDKYGVEEIDFLDANMIVDRKRVVEIFKGMKGMGLVWANPGGMWAGGLDKELLTLMKESGCYQVTFAVESSNEFILQNVIHKPTKLEQVKPLVDHCKKIGIDTHAFFVSGFPEESVESIKNNYKFAKEVGFTSATFNIVQPLPGSEMWEKYGNDSMDFSRIDLKYATIKHPEIAPRDLERMIRKMNKKFNSSIIYRNPKIFFKKYVRNLLRKHSFKFFKKMFARQ